MLWPLLRTCQTCHVCTHLAISIPLPLYFTLPKWLIGLPAFRLGEIKCDHAERSISWIVSFSALSFLVAWWAGFLVPGMQMTLDTAAVSNSYREMFTSARIDRSTEWVFVDNELYKSFESDRLVKSIDMSFRTVIASRGCLTSSIS